MIDGLPGACLPVLLMHTTDNVSANHWLWKTGMFQESDAMVFNPWDSHHPTFSLQTLTLSYINSLKYVCFLAVQPILCDPMYCSMPVACTVACTCTVATPCTVACQTTLSSTSSWSLLKLMSTESVVLSNHLIFYHSLLLSPSIFLSIKVFSSELPVCIRRLSIRVSA